MDKVIIDGVDVSGCEFYFEDNGVIAPDGTPEQANICASPEKSCEKSDSCYCNKDCYYKQLQRAKAELKKYEDMAKKGLEEFKDVGGCWGCGLQLQLNQDMEDIKKLKAENDNLKDDIDKQQLYVDSLEQENEKLKQENEQIKKDYAKLHIDFAKCNEENERLKARLRPLEDSYFKGLSSIEIVELAKKSIRITTENRKLEYALQEIRDIAERQLLITNVRTYQMVYYADFYQYRNEIIAKINEVIGAEE